MTNIEFKKIHVFSVGKIFALVHLVLGLIVVGTFAFISQIITKSMMVSADPMAMNPMALYASNLPSPIFFMVGLPIFYTIGGFIIGLLSALFYNLCAKFVGGIQIDVKEIEEIEQQVQTPQQPIQPQQPVQNQKSMPQQPIQ